MVVGGVEVYEHLGEVGEPSSERFAVLKPRLIHGQTLLPARRLKRRADLSGDELAVDYPELPFGALVGHECGARTPCGFGEHSNGAAPYSRANASTAAAAWRGLCARPVTLCVREVNAHRHGAA